MACLPIYLKWLLCFISGTWVVVNQVLFCGLISNDPIFLYSHALKSVVLARYHKYLADDR